MPPQSLHLQSAGLAVAVKAKATTARTAKRIFFIILDFSVEVSLKFPSVNRDGSRRDGDIRLAAEERADGGCARGRTRRLYVAGRRDIPPADKLPKRPAKQPLSSRVPRQ